MSFRARHTGECGDCGQSIIIGQEVTYHGPDGIIHYICPPAKKICPKCFIEMTTEECDNCA